MKIIVDTNKVFSAILYTNSQIAGILLHSTDQFNFYSTRFLFSEIYEHKEKIIQITDYSDSEFEEITKLVTKNIRFIDLALLPVETIQRAEEMVKDIDIDDTEFVALTDHLEGKLWTGDKKLKTGLEKKGWNNFITTDELFERIFL